MGYSRFEIMDFLTIALLAMQVQLASVSGMVTKPGGNEPLPRAKVMLSPVGPEQTGIVLSNDPRLRSVVSQDDGTFRIEGVPPGDYRLSVDSARYGRATYGQRRPDGPGTILSIGQDDQLSGLRLSMVSTGAIAGRVTNRNGEPEANAAVQALKYAYRNGSRVLVPAQMTQTDDRGEYRLFWLPPGNYVVAAASKKSSPYGAINLARIPDISYIRPGAASGPMAEQDLSEFMVSQSRLESAVVTRVLEDGTLQEEQWAPVYYPATTDRRLATPLQVTANATLTGIDLALEPVPVGDIRELQEARERKLPNFGATSPVAVAGQIAIENISSGTVNPDVLSGLSMFFMPTGAGVPVQLGREAVLENGAFVLNAPPGNYRLLVNGAANPLLNRSSLYLKSIRFEGVDAMDSVHITASPQGRIEVVLATETGSVQGIVRDFRATPAAGATVVLVPDLGREREERYIATTTNANGMFRLPGIVAGNYKLFAWNDVETGAWQDPEFLRTYEFRGRAVVVAGSIQDVELVSLDTP